mgnify:CR=1 FL=1
MVQIRDDPIISAMERSGYPPWFRDEAGEESEGGEEDGKL